MRFLKDLLFTEMFLIKGHANTAGRRLSTFLNDTRKDFLEMEEATLIRQDGSGRMTAACIQVRVDDILFAHELEVSGDEGLKLLSERGKDEIEVTVHFNGTIPVQLSGKVRKQSLDSSTLHHHDFIVMVEPRIEGLAIPPGHECTVFKDLSYAIVNRNRLALILRR